MADDNRELNLHQQYLDPKILDKVTALELKARSVVEGFMMGLNRSPFQGFSIEFKQHREYSHGDDTRFMDWKLFGKTDRLYLKQYEQETNLRAHLIVDVSRSMKYRSEFESKFDYASYAAAALSYLILMQRDSASLSLFNNKVVKHIPDKSSRRNLHTFLLELSQTTPEGETDIPTAFRYLAESIQRRGMIIIISDLFDDPERIFEGLKYFKSKKHDVIVFHLFDEYELTFPFQRLTMFQGMEGPEKKVVDPKALRAEYLASVEQFTQTIQRGCLNYGIDYTRVSTAQPLDVVLAAYLAKRLKILKQ